MEGETREEVLNITTNPFGKRKITLVGPSQVGKTSLVNRMCYNEFRSFEPTLGANFTCSSLQGRNGTRYELDFWDTAGQERYQCLTPIYFPNTFAFWMVFDLSKDDSLDELVDYAEQVQERMGGEKYKVYLIGNKKDLVGPNVMDLFDLTPFKETFKDHKFFMVSAKTGENISLLWEELRADCESSTGKEEPLQNRVDLGYTRESPEKKGCCKGSSGSSFRKYEYVNSDLEITVPREINWGMPEEKNKEKKPKRSPKNEGAFLGRPDNSERNLGTWGFLIPK